MPRHTEIAHLSSPYLDLIDDVYIGSGSSTGTGGQPYPGQLGAFMELTEAQALAMSSVPATLTLHGGIYQYVKFKSSLTAATPAIGDLVIVDQSATTPGALADDPTQATGLTSTTMKSIIGVSEAAPVASATQLVQLWPRFWNE